MWCYSKHMLIINSLGLINSFCELVIVYTISFIFISYLVLLIDIEHLIWQLNFSERSTPPGLTNAGTYQWWPQHYTLGYKLWGIQYPNAGFYPLVSNVTFYCPLLFSLSDYTCKSVFFSKQIIFFSRNKLTNNNFSYDLSVKRQGNGSLAEASERQRLLSSTSQRALQ